MLTCIQLPNQEPVSLEQAKNFLKIDHDNEDFLIKNIIKAARQFVEDFTGQSLLEQQWQFKIFPEHFWRGPLLSFLQPSPTGVRLHLPKIPILKIENIQLQYDHHTPYILQEKEYYVDNASVKGQLFIHSLYYTRIVQLQVDYTAGYGKDAAHIPPIFNHALLMKCAELYENRGDQSPNLRLSATEQLLEPYKILHFGLNRPEFF